MIPDEGERFRGLTAFSGSLASACPTASASRNVWISREVFTCGD